jgi:uncharacterized protein DUF4386
VTRTRNARLAGFAFLFYIAVGITSMVLFGRATSGDGMAAKLVTIGQHANDVRVVAVLTLLASVSAVVLGVTLFAITREQDEDLARLGMMCRVIEGMNGAVGIEGTLGLLWLATASGASAPDPASAQALAAYWLKSSPTISATFFAIGSTLFSWLLLRGRMIPKPLAQLGVAASVLLVLLLPLQLGRQFGGVIGWLQWMPMLVFEVWLALWFLIKGVARPSIQG